MVVQIAQSKLKLKSSENFSKILQPTFIYLCSPAPMYREVWSEVLQIGADFQMTFPAAGYIVKFFAESDFVGCSNIQLHCFLLGQTVWQFVEERMR